MKKKNLNLNKARTVKNDEFYTLYEDIEREIFYYKDEFEGKIIYCNCDDPNRSAFWRFFHLNFERLNLKGLVATYYIEGMQTFLYRYSGGNDTDISSYDQFSLKEDGDFRSNECQELLNECDIVVSNPPFSLFSDYIQLLLKYEKKFLIIGNKNAATFKDIFPYVKKRGDYIWVSQCKRIFTTRWNNKGIWKYWMVYKFAKGKMHQKTESYASLL